MTQTSQSPETTTQLQGFDEFVHTTMQDWKLPGLAIAIVKDGKIILSQGFGKRNIAQDLEVTPNTLFPIGSCTKAFTTTIMGMLVDEGKLDWDTPVKQYLPTFKMYDPYVTERMTPRDLVTHRSGLPRHDLMWYHSTRSRQELFDRLQYLEPSKDFRSLWQYQNLMYMTAGYLAGEVAGQSWEDLVQKRLFDPLGMTSSNFSVITSRQTPDFALPYGEEKDEVKEKAFYDEFQAIAPAGAIVSNVVDMSKWLLFNLNKGKHGDAQLISEAQLTQIHTPQMVVSDPKKYTEIFYISYSLGWLVTSYRGHTMIQHGGGIDGFSALTTLLPDDNMGIVVLTNMEGCPVHSIVTFNACERLLGLEATPWHERIKKEVAEMKTAAEKSKEQSASGRVPETHLSHALDAYTGDFEHPGYGTLSIIRDEEQLKASFNSMVFPLTHYHYDIFEATFERFGLQAKVSFSTNTKGDIDSLAIPFEPTVKEIIFKRVASKEMTEKGFLEQFVGEYEFMGRSIAIALRGEKTLIASIPGQPDYELEPYKGTEFQLKGLAGFSLEFKKDDTGVVAEVVVTQPYGVVIAKRKM
ncbi:MAG TPA: serine hydrolase [Ktedonobacteraceae bacterium]|nr:serine hydrolase [Ktedonobacteraceae bacterium]